ncbi:amp-binding enzyme family protein [Stylonychia lemnae]|uniref:Amp-binding enzyme family protein n=1 Tax=Stylonychia lemnae TaxID=5949 RepID=A0A078AGW3_STYLE|nr:amp-binding enzyme family protein [Stylonychia lemnae]|eukprot:CDW80098.1 amp-binding enzyme family protein [Stylonychia lemnae]
MGNQPLIMGKYIGEKKPGETRILRNALIPDGVDLISDHMGLRTLPDIYEQMINMKNQYRLNYKQNPGKVFTGTRKQTKLEDGKIQFGEYQWKKYGDVYESSKAIASYLVHHDLCPKVQTEHDGEFKFLSIYAKNREEWIETDLGCAMTSITVVTLYDTLGKDSIEYILDQSQIKTLVLSADKIKIILEIKAVGKLPSLSHLIYFDEAKDQDLEKAAEIGVTLVQYKQAVSEGKTYQNVIFETPEPDTVYTLCYTSGTTGMPKGVMITHKNMIANISAINRFDGVFSFQDDDVYISYLPLAHVFERMCMIACMTYQVRYGFFQGDVMKLKDDLAVLRPTLMVSVPRLFSRFYDGMQAKVKDLKGPSKTLFEWGLQKKLYNLKHYGKCTHTFYDTMIFNKFRDLLGGRMRMMVTGSAPISKDILTFLKVAFCCPILEGYGQTESAAPASITWMNDPDGGHVGAPFPSCDFKLVDVPEMKYTSEDVDENEQSIPRGEICYKGPNCFKGYFNNPKATKETIDEDGWVHTGDIGQFQQNGKIKIIDRKKNIFKLSQGEYVIPDKIENKLIESNYVSQIFVYGDSLQHNLVAIVVPDKHHLQKWAKEQDLQESEDYEALIKSPVVNKFLLDEIKTLSRSAGVSYNHLFLPSKLIIYSSSDLRFPQRST